MFGDIKIDSDVLYAITCTVIIIACIIGMIFMVVWGRSIEEYFERIASSLEEISKKMK